MKRNLLLIAGLTLFIGSGVIGCAQIPAPPPSPDVPMRSAADLDQMLGPIALYPDPLLSEVLAAATLPSELVLADRYLGSGGDPSLVDQEPWDDSVKGLTRYPSVLKWMDDNLAWTTAVGQAFTYQQPDVMDSIQRLRARAQTLGNLQTTPQENIYTDDGTIEILPANPDELYLPIYQPDQVYFQPAYGVPFISFGVGWTAGPWLNHDFDWHHHHVVVWSHDHPRPGDWWSHPPGQRPPVQPGHTVVWQPHVHGVQPPGGFDRGWNPAAPRSTVTVIGRGAPPPSSAAHNGAYTVYGGEPRGGAVEHSASEGHPHPAPASGALIGVQSSRETHEFSTRGQESRQETVSHSTPAPTHSEPAHSEPATHSGGGGKH